MVPVTVTKCLATSPISSVPFLTLRKTRSNASLAIAAPGPAALNHWGHPQQPRVFGLGIWATFCRFQHRFRRHAWSSAAKPARLLCQQPSESAALLTCESFIARHLQDRDMPWLCAHLGPCCSQSAGANHQQCTPGQPHLPVHVVLSHVGVSLLTSEVTISTSPSSTSAPCWGVCSKMHWTAACKATSGKFQTSSVCTGGLSLTLHAVLKDAAHVLRCIYILFPSVER